MGQFHTFTMNIIHSSCGYKRV